jgi:transposase InsO family protein
MFLVDGGHAISSFERTTLYHKDGKPYLTARLEKQGHLHYILSQIVKNDGHVNMSLDGNPSYQIWHQRFAHASDLALLHVSDNTILKGIIPPPSKDMEICVGCALGKTHEKSFPPNLERATSIGELIHSDLLEMPILSYHHSKYVVVILDDYSSCVLVRFIKNKSEVTDIIKQYVKLTLTQCEVKVKRIRTDNGGEYMSTMLSDFFKDRGIIHELSAPHIHQQNGWAERINCTLQEKSQAMHLHACLPDSYWEFSISTAVHAYNRTPMKHLNWNTPLGIQ